MRISGSHFRRRGLTLLEVLVATAIFLVALGGLTQLLTVANNAAYEARVLSQAGQLAQTKLAELRAGIQTLQSVSDDELEEDPSFRWSLDVSEGPAPNLSLATVRVYRLRPNLTPIQVELSEYVLSPEMIGSTMDVGPVLNNQSAPESGDSGSTDPNASGGGMTGGAGMTGGGGMTGGAGGGMMGGRGMTGGMGGGMTGGRGRMGGGAIGGGRGAGGGMGGGATGGGRGAGGGTGGETGGGRGAGKGG